MWRVLSLLTLLAVVGLGIPYLYCSAVVAAMVASAMGWRGSVDSQAFIIITTFSWAPYIAVLAGSVAWTYFAFRKRRVAPPGLTDASRQ